MNILKVSFRYLRFKPLQSLLQVVLFGFGTSIIILLLLFSTQLEQRLSASSKGIDLVVGAKGSPLQLILCNIFHIDFPTGNISLREAEELVKNRMIKSAIPLALGDSYNGWRIVGTDTAYLTHYGVHLAEGAVWSATMEVTLGAQVAQQLQMKAGDTFEGQHGMGEGGHVHEGIPYRVVGVLAPSGTVVDNLILTGVRSVWAVHHLEDDLNSEIDHDHDHSHGHHDSPLGTGSQPGTLVAGTFPWEADSLKEITSLLVKYRSAMAAISMPRYINQQTDMQAASPAFETARLFSLVGVGVDIVRYFAWIVMAISALSIFISLYASLSERAFDLALMRAQGASRLRLFTGILLEGLILTAIGSVLGILVGHGVMEWMAVALPEAGKSGITGKVFYTEELFIFILALVIGGLASLLPAIRVYRTDISNTLAQG
jgi:putative ABC transport system permease protein